MSIRKLQLRGVASFAIAIAALYAQGALADHSVLECHFGKLPKTSAEAPTLDIVAPGVLSPIPLNSVQYTDKAITRKVMVQELFVRRSETNTVEVIARLINCTDYPLQVEGRTSFMDSTQVPSEPTSAWRRVILAPRSIGVYRELSTTAQPANFLVELREGT
jgi:hypothetical protein